jgi:hypothetical protein
MTTGGPDVSNASSRGLGLAKCGVKTDLNVRMDGGLDEPSRLVIRSDFGYHSGAERSEEPGTHD